MSEPVPASSEQPNQPVAATAADPAAAPTPAPAAKTADPVVTTATKEPEPIDDAAAAALKAVTDADKVKADADAAAAAKAAEDAARATSVPEVYELKAPDGMQADPGLMPALTPALKSAGLTQKQFETVAQSFLEFQKGLPAQILARDLEVTRSDPTLGGMNYPKTIQHVNLALNTFSDPSFGKFLTQAGVANRLEFVRVFARIGEALARASDGPARGAPDGGEQRSVADKLYGTPKT